MSREFLESFFPSVTTLGKRFAPSIVERYFPDDAAMLCPEVAVVKMGYTIRNPILGVGAVVGVLIGGVGVATIAGWNLNTTPQQHRSFVLAFAFFGLMNVTALTLHSFFPASQLTMPEEYPLWWALDCLFTGWSASALAFGCSDIYRRQTPFALVDAVAKSLPYVGWIGLAMMASLAVILFVWYRKTYALELFYLIPIVTAAVALCPLLLQSLRRVLRHTADGDNGMETRRIVCYVVVYGGGILVLTLGILLDARTCRYLGQQWGDTFMAGTTTFWGCNIVFVGILLWLPHIMTCSEGRKSKSVTENKRRKLKRHVEKRHGE